MSDVWVGRINRWIEKLLDVKGGPTVVDVDPSIVIDVPFDRPADERFQLGWNSFGAAINTAAVAASNAQAQIRNPAGSNVVAVLESCIVQQLTATTRSSITLQEFTAQVDLTTVVTPTPMDRRMNFQGSNMIISATGNGPFGNGVLGCVVSGISFQFIQYENQELQILPGDGIRLGNNTVNEAISVSFLWRERALEPSELA